MRRLVVAAGAVLAYLLGTLAGEKPGRHRAWCPCKGCEAARWTAR